MLPKQDKKTIKQHKELLWFGRCNIHLRIGTVESSNTFTVYKVITL